MLGSNTLMLFNILVSWFLAAPAADPPTAPEVSWNPSSIDGELDRCAADKIRLGKETSPRVSFPEELLVAQVVKKGVPELAARRAIQYFNQNQGQIPNKRVLTVVNFAASALEVRFWTIRIPSADVSGYTVQHGRESDPDQDGFINSLYHFSNEPLSFKSIPGFALTGGVVDGDNGKVLLIHGMEPGRNDQACRRSLVIGPGQKVGTVWRSRGSLLLEKKVSDQVIREIKNGSVIYIFAGQ